MNEDHESATFVRRAFADTRQAPEPGLTQRVLTRVAERRARGAAEKERERTGPMLAVAALGLATLTVVVLLAGSGRINLTTSRPAPAAPPALVGPDRVPAIVYPGSLVAKGAPDGVSDWDGKLLDVLPGTVHPDRISADGSLLAQPIGDTPPAPIPAAWTIFDRQGKLLTRVGPLFGSWSADGAHVSCLFEGAKGGASITTIDFSNPRAPKQRSVAVRTADGTPLTGAWEGLACSARSGRLLAAEDTPGTGKGISALAVIDLSTGRVVAQRSLAGAQPVIRVAVSPDARYAARITLSNHSEIIDLGTGRVVGEVAGQICTFSGNGALVLTSTGGCGAGITVGGPPSDVALVEWGTGRKAWTSHAGPLILAIEPDGTDLALVVYQPGQPSSALIVRGDGRRLALPPVR
jgi:hypothetical protein